MKSFMVKSMTEEAYSTICVLGEEDNMFEKTPKRSRLATSDLSTEESDKTPNVDTMCMEECSNKASPLLNFSQDENNDEYYNTPVKKHKSSSNYNIVVSSATTVPRKNSIQGPYNNLGEFEQVSNLK